MNVNNKDEFFAELEISEEQISLDDIEITFLSTKEMPTDWQVDPDIPLGEYTNWIDILEGMVLGQMEIDSITGEIKIGGTFGGNYRNMFFYH